MAQNHDVLSNDTTNSSTDGKNWQIRIYRVVIPVVAIMIIFTGSVALLISMFKPEFFPPIWETYRLALGAVVLFCFGSAIFKLR